MHRRIKGHTSSVYALTCTPDGATLASGSFDTTVRLWRYAPFLILVTYI
jgi:WD40 repeat protein